MLTVGRPGNRLQLESVNLLWYGMRAEEPSWWVRMETTFGREKEELERVLGSGNFPRAPLQGKLLKYICEEYLRGKVRSN